MDQDRQSGWRPTRGRVLWTSGIVVGLAFLVIVICGYLFGLKWTGLPKQTLWDWLDLLIVPVVLALGGYFLNSSQTRATQAAADRRAQDEALQAYLDDMSDMLLPNKELPSLYKAIPGDSLSSVARARTLTVLPRLAGDGKGRVVHFLYEAGLIAQDRPIVFLKDHPIVDLGGANLSRADLSGADLSRVGLSGTNRSRAILNGANLSRADLHRADLTEATLRGADLSGANLIGAILSGADLFEVNLSGANLSGAELQNASLDWANLTGALLKRANVSWLHLTGAHLERADLSGANLIGADLSRAGLSGANLSEADLHRADLTEANLGGATRISNEQIEQQAESLKGAIMPDGQKYEDWRKSKDREEDGENNGH